ncbi:hypothetical protein B0T10DRAFT_565412 [Thelonectria olida]|uniref:Uncharacterized protein n=1 Tax=Thelonectria olida TaxID=1576542 RepID=A0A9P8VZ23_9HYPO|nr:hypothetical protein B0T10DRAFT_565412 [Thelonectria olida]
MRPSSILLLSPWLLLHASAGDQVMNPSYEERVCRRLPGLDGCTGQLEIPYGSAAKYCTTKSGNTYICGTIVLKEKVNVCDAVRQALPGQPGQDFASKGRAMCFCLPWAIRMSTMEEFYPIYEDGDLSAKSRNLANFVQIIDQCIRDNNLSIDDGRPKTIRNMKSTKDWSLVRGADIDVTMWRNLMKAIDGCFDGACDEKAISDWYWEYYELSDGLTDGELFDMLNNWVTLYGTLKAKISDVAKAAKGLQDRHKAANAAVSTVKKSICKGTTCNGSIAKSFLGKVSKALATVKNRQDVSKGCESAAKAIPLMVASTETAIEATNRIPEASYLKNLFESGEITSLSDVIKGFSVVSVLPNVALDLRKKVVHIILLTKYASKVKTTQSQLNDVLVTDWKKRTDLFKTPAQKKVRDGFIQIQGIMKKEFKDPLAKLLKAIQSLDDTLSKFPLRKNQIQIEHGAQLYRRWNLNSFTVPCNYKDTATYTRNGFTASAEYTKVDSCQFGPDWYYLPNHRIPYIMWRFYAA